MVGGTAELHYFHTDDCVAPIIITIFSYLYTIVFYCDSFGHLLLFKSPHPAIIANRHLSRSIYELSLTANPQPKHPYISLISHQVLVFKAPYQQQQQKIPLFYTLFFYILVHLFEGVSRELIIKKCNARTVMAVHYLIVSPHRFNPARKPPKRAALYEKYLPAPEN